MQVAVLSQSLSHQVVSGLKLSRLRVALCVIALGSLPFAAHAAEPIALDSSLIASLQVRAHNAPPQEQVQLFADIADKISQLATREIAAGDAEKAEATLKQLESCTAEIEIGLKKNSKGLKKTEMMLHTTNRRLVDLVRSASYELKPMVQNALKRLDRAQAVLLSAVFEK